MKKTYRSVACPECENRIHFTETPSIRTCRNPSCKTVCTVEETPPRRPCVRTISHWYFKFRGDLPLSARRLSAFEKRVAKRLTQIGKLREEFTPQGIHYVSAE